MQFSINIINQQKILRSCSIKFENHNFCLPGFGSNWKYFFKEKKTLNNFKIKLKSNSKNIKLSKYIVKWNVQ